MSQLKSLLYLLPQLWETLFEKVITVAYPFAPLELPSNFRGRVRIEPDLCRGCGACVRDCPAFGLELESEGRDEFRLIHYPDRCICCGQCEESCRFDAIRLTNEFVEPTFGERPEREVLVDRKPESVTSR
ncbi:MAG: 4Fe-4S binding protein [Chloroflexota bacterium]|nr:4Fe-4S binding protein [Chloroflexota bacterium]